MTTQLQHDGAADLAACLRGLPRRLKIGAYDWKMAIEEGAGEGGDALYGQADFDTNSIRLWPVNMTSPGHAVGIVLHECFHVIFDNQGLTHLKRDKDDREEQIVLGFEAGMISLLRDNPKLLTWMKKWLSKTV